MRSSIRVLLTVAFIGMVIGPLLLVGVVLAWQSFTTQQQQALNLQREVAQRVSIQMTAFFKGLENELRVISQVQGLQGLDRNKQNGILSELLSYQVVFEELVLLDNEGQEQIHISRTNLASTHLGNRAEADEFVIPQTIGQIYYSPIRFEESTGEPLLTIAVPLLDVRTGQIDGVLLSEARIKKIWDLIADIQVSPGQSVYIVNAQDEVVAHRNPSVVLRSTIFNVPDQDGVQPGLTGSSTVLAVETVRFGQQEFNIVVEQAWSEALALAINSIYVIVAIIMATLVLGGILGFLIVRQIVRPLQAMAITAQAISAGDLSQQVKITRQDEIGVLAKAFNTMTFQLREFIDSLEQRVANRTQRLEIIASLNERLSAILELETLLMVMVNQVREAFGYYHVQVYLLDEQQQRLVMTAGVGEAGAKMKAAGHHIFLDAPASLVARAARTGEVVRVDKVREAVDWLPNPLLPDTYSEMVVPISLEGQVVGVLDVQDDEVAGLDEGDANLLRSLASQVAVAMRNARLFAEVETELAQARAAQEKYVEQAWQQRKGQLQKLEHLHTRLVAAPALAEATLTQAKQLAWVQNRPALVTLAGIEPNSTSIVAPVTLSGKTIGVLQVHRLDSTGGAEAETPPWTDEDLAVVETVLDQVAQAAENLRLFEETRERATQEQTIREITDKLRATSNLDALLETATRELGQHLGVRHTVLELGIEPTHSSISLSNRPDNGR